MGYLSIGNLYKEQDILLFKECYAMEKIHGCVHFDTPIRMADFSLKIISKVKVGDKVLGVKDGIIVEAEVCKKFNNGKAERWIKIVTTRNGAGRGPSTTKVVCTPEHRFWNPSDKCYVLAKDLKVGQQVISIRNDYTLSYVQEQVLLGKLLGDGYIKIGSNTAHIEFGHKKEHEAYVDYCLDALGSLAHKVNKEYISGFGSTMVRSNTYRNYHIFQKFSDFIKTGKKVIPTWVSCELSPIAIAFWFMDDGSLNYHKDQEDRVTFHVCAFSDEDVAILIKGLSNLGIASTMRLADGHRRLFLDAKNTKKLFSLIYPYIPACMQYKLSQEFRGFYGGKLPKLSEACNQTLVVQTIRSINDDYTPYAPSRKHDIETTTNNYFAGDLLVHNSSAHVAWNINEGIRYFSGGEKQESFKAIFNEVILTEKFKVLGLSKITIYGEAYGGKQQGMKATYGDKLKFIAFDVKIDDNWLSVTQAESIVVERLGLEFVHYVKMPTDLALIDKERDADSVQAVRNGCGEGKKREGIVLRPIIEVRKNNDDRIMAKHKREDFSERVTHQKVVDPAERQVLEDARAIALEWVTPMRLQHVTDKLAAAKIALGKGCEIGMEDTKDVILAMTEDIIREAHGEIVDSKEARRAIGNATATLFKESIKAKFREEANQDHTPTTV